MDQLDDAALMDGLAGATLTASSFHHQDHVRAVWLYLERWGVLDTLERFPRHIRGFAASLGKPEIYHETITWAYILLVHERRAGRPEGETWEEFAGGNADLLDWSDSVLNRYYSKERLMGKEARRTFLFPDLGMEAAS